MSVGKLASRVVVIIGGTSGLGLSAARACAAEGARLVVMGRSEEKCQAAGRALGEAAEVVRGDAEDAEAAARAIERAIDRFGRFDALYHVAGGSGRRFGDGPLDQLTEQAIEQTLRWNLYSVVYSNRAAVQAWTRLGGPGVVLNLGSVLACSPSPRWFATHVYAAAKAAIVGLTRSCAAYYAPAGIRFNVLAPGLVETPMAARASGDPNIQAYIAEKQPLGGGGMPRPNDYDEAVVLLLSDASRMMTGQVVTIDAGWSVSEPASAPRESSPHP